MIGIVSAALLVTIALSFGVAILDAVNLVKLVTAFVLLQRFSSIGASGAQNLPGSIGASLSTVFSFISIVNFDLQILRPGCSIPAFNFIRLFLGTLLLVALTGCMFFLACYSRLMWRRWQEKEGKRKRNELEIDSRNEEEQEERYEMIQQILKEAASAGTSTSSAAKEKFSSSKPPPKISLSRIFLITPEEDFRRRLTHSLRIRIHICNKPNF